MVRVVSSVRIRVAPSCTSLRIAPTAFVQGGRLDVHVYVHACAYVHVHAHAHACMCMRACACACACVRAWRPDLPPHGNDCLIQSSHACMCMCMCACMLHGAHLPPHGNDCLIQSSRLECNGLGRVEELLQAHLCICASVHSLYAHVRMIVRMCACVVLGDSTVAARCI